VNIGACVLEVLAALMQQHVDLDV